MKGGLLQLATVGKEDSVLINKPQIFHFKKVYKKHTNFSIDSNQMILGEKKFNTDFEINLRKDGDLLKDLIFYLEIPYFDIFKKINTSTTEFNRTESDKIYYKYLNMKALVYFVDKDNFYIIPENVLKLDNNVKENNIDTIDVIAINSKEYSKYFNVGSTINEIVIDDNRKHNSVPYLKTIDSFWFNNLINNIQEDESEKFNFSLLDYKRFSQWFNNLVEQRLFLNYQNLFNMNILKQKYQINLTTEDNEIVNELKKYYEIIEKFDTLTESNYLNEDLDIDSSIINNFKIKKYDFTFEKMEEFLLQTIKYSSRFIKYLLTKLYDNNIDNFFIFYNMFKVGYEVDNDIISKNSNNYDNNIWDDYIGNKFKSNFDNISSNVFNSGFFDAFIESSNYIEKQIDNLWTTLQLSNDNIKLIFSILYTFIERYESYSKFESINFFDFFESNTDANFFYRLKQNITNYSDVQLTNLTEIYTNYGKKFDLTLIYNYLIYNLTYQINEFKEFENFNNISKQNIQFIYWWRNKIANTIFLRYKRIQQKTSTSGNNFYPNFDNIKEENELINFFYTFVPNNIISINEIKKELYKIFNSYSYLATITNDSNDSTTYKILSYKTAVTNQTYDKNLNGTIDFQYKISIDLSDITQKEREISFVSHTNKIRKSFFDEKFTLQILYQEDYYGVIANYSSGKTTLTLDQDLNISENFELLVTLYMPICKYYFEYTPVTITKNELTFDDDNRTFLYDKYLETSKLKFSLESEPEEIISYIDLLTETNTAEGNEHSLVLLDNYYISSDLFSSNTIGNYNIVLYQLTNYINSVTTTNFEITSETINDIVKNVLTINTSGFFSYNSSNLYDIQYNSVKYRCTLTEVPGSTSQFVINGTIPSDLIGSSVTSYYIIEYSSVINAVTLFTLTGTTIESSEISNINISTSNKTFDYSGSTTLDADYNLVFQNNRYYQVNITSTVGNTYQINNSTFDIESSFSIITGYRITFTDSTVLSTSIDYYFSFTVISSTSSLSQNIILKPVLTNGTNFISASNKFKYEIESLENTSYTSLVTDDSLTFTINGTNNFIQDNILFKRYINSSNNENFITTNKFIGNTVKYYFDDSKTYFLTIKYINSTIDKKKIVFDDSESLNYVKFTDTNTQKYIIDEFINFDSVEEISIQSVHNFYKDLDFTGYVSVDSNQSYYLNIPILSTNTSNYENYYKYIIYTLSTYYLIYNSTTINLGNPSVESNVLIFKILNPEDNFTSSSTSSTYTIRICHNDILPNLINFTSFYTLEAENKCYDLMDYFIQTPMLIFLDNNSTKNSNVLLYNFPIDINNVDTINYLKFNDQYMHLRESINSNQILRYDDNLISSVFDFNIIEIVDSQNQARFYKKEILIEDIESSISNIISNEQINDLITLMETTNTLAINLIQTYGINAINAGSFGNTIKQLLNNFNNLNASNLLNESDDITKINNNITLIEQNIKHNVIGNFNYHDFNLYSKMVLDFYISDDLNKVSYDNNLGLSVSSSSGKSIFITNYKPLQLANKLNSDMLSYLTNYKTEISNQIDYIEKNKSWLKLGSEDINNDFGYFYDFQDYYKEFLYEKNNYKYSFEYLSNDIYSKYPELNKTSQINRKNITITDNNLESSDKLNITNETIISNNINNKKSNYNYIEDSFNYLGPSLISDNKIIKNSINLSFDSDLSYMFINDASDCYLAKNLTNYNFEIDNKINKFMKNSYLRQISDSNVDLNLVEIEMYIYEIKIDDKSDFQVNDYILLNNYICQIISLDFNNSNNLGVSIFNILDFKYPKFYLGKLRSDSYLSSNDSIILKKNMHNLIDFSETEYTFTEIINIHKFNNKIYSHDSNKIYCTLEDGILSFDNIYDEYYTFVTGTQIYDLSDSILNGLPLILQNGIVSYHNINKDLSSESLIYDEDNIYYLKSSIDFTVPKNTWFLNGKLESVLVKFDYQIDYDNKYIFITSDMYENIKNSFLFHNNNFFKVSDFDISNNINTNYDSNKLVYYLDNVYYDKLHPLDLIPGRTYQFTTESESNENYQLLFSVTEDGTHNNGINYTSSLTINGNLGRPNSYTEIVLPNFEITLYFYSQTTEKMGGKLSITRGLEIIDVEVYDENGQNKFFLDGSIDVTLEAGKTYRFNNSDLTNLGHPLKFSETIDGTHSVGNEYTTNVSTNGTAGTENSYVEIIIPLDKTELFMYCQNHSGMGGKITIDNSVKIIEVNVGLNPSSFLIREDVFSGQNDFYSQTLIENTSITFNPLLNNTNSILTSNNYFEIPNYQTYLVNNDVIYNYNLNLLFDQSNVRPLEVQLTDTNNEFNRLRYNLYSDNLFTNQIDSMLIISESLIGLTNALSVDINFYLKFDVSDSTVVDQNGGYNHYYLNKEKVSFIEIAPLNNNIEILSLDQSSSSFMFTIKSGLVLHKRNFNKFDFNVNFIYDSVSYDFKIVVRVLADDNYTLSLQESYDTNSYTLLNEPYIINDLTTYKNKLKDTNIGFKGCIPNIFRSDDNTIILINNSVTLSNIKSYDKKVKYMDIEEDIGSFLQETKVSTVSNINDKVNYYDVLGNSSISENKITINSNIENLISLTKNIVLFTNNRLYYVNIISQETNLITIDYKFSTEITEGLIYINLFESKLVEREISINESLELIISPFGGLRYGEIIELNGVVVLIKDYDLEYKGYTFQIISTHVSFEIKTYYSNYYSIGLINNYNKKFNLVNLKQKNLLISKKSADIYFGDLVINSKNISFYNSNNFDLYDDTINYCFNHEGFDLFLHKLNNEWYYFGNYLGTNFNLVATYTENNVEKNTILKVRHIFNNKIFWDEDYTTILDNLLVKINNKYSFYFPFQPFEVKYLEFENNCSLNYNGSGIIEIQKDYYMINHGNISNFENNVFSGYYQIIPFEDFKSEFSNYNVDVYSFKKECFDNIDFYRSENIYFNGVDNINTNLVDVSFNNTIGFYYYNSVNYEYPLYLKQTNLSQGSKVINNITLYYDSLSYSTSVPSSTLGLTSFNDYFDLIFYVFKDSKYYYPLYLDINKLSTSDEDNKNKNVKISCEIKDKESIININSTPEIYSYVGANYIYSITTEPTDCIITTSNLPYWLQLNGSVGNYTLSGTPRLEDISNNKINIIANYGDSYTSQTFEISITELSTDFNFTSKPTTYLNVGDNYSYTVDASPNLNSINIISKPIWLDFSNNILSGSPSLDFNGSNNLIIEAEDTNNNKIYQKFSILVNRLYPPYIYSQPITSLGQSEFYSYNIQYNLNNSDNVTLTYKHLPSWLTLVGNTLSGTSPSEDGDHRVVLEVSNSNIKTRQLYTINVSDSNDYTITSNPITFCFNNNEYQYQLTISDISNTSEVTLLDAPSWLSIDENFIIRGTPNNCFLKNNKVNIQAKKSDGITFKQEFHIYVFDNQEKIIKLNQGIYENIISNLNLDFFTTIILNSSFYTLSKIVNFENRSEIYVKEFIDLSGQCDLTFPININAKKKEVINDHFINLTNGIINYTYSNGPNLTVESIIFCYYYETDSTQLQVRSFNVDLYQDLKFTSDEDFTLFFEENSLLVSIYLENFINIEIYNSDSNTHYFKKLPFELKTNSKILIEEKKNDQIFIYYLIINLENGILKLEEDISNDDSLFFINKVIPIKIVNNIIQFVNPIIKQNNYFGVNSREYVINWMSIPIKIVSKPILSNKKWIIEIETKYLNLLDQFEVYSNKIDDSNFKINYLFENSKNYLVYSSLPEIKEKFVYIKKIDYFNSLKRIYTNYKSNLKIDDKSLENLINDEWKLSSEKIIVPMIITEGNRNKEYTITSGFNFENINLNNDNIKFYLDNDSNLILNDGVDKNNRLQLITQNITSNTDVNLYIESKRNRIIIDDSNELNSSVNSIIEILMKNEVKTTFKFNTSKPLIDWTSISFYNNKNYKSKNMVLNKNFTSDSSGNTIIEDNLVDSVLLYEETLENSDIITKISLLTENNFENYYKLVNLRKIENIIYKFIKENSDKLDFWNNPISKINNYLQKYKNDDDVKNYSIKSNCLVKNDEDITNTSYFKVNQGNIIRLAYLDNQFDLEIVTNNLKVYRSYNKINKVIQELIKNVDNYYSGVNSHLVFQKIEEIYNLKDNYLKFLIDGYTFNFNYSILTLEKLIISKQWEDLRNKNLELNTLFNKEFNDSLKIVYDNHSNLQTGIIENNLELKKFGIESYGNIINFDSTQESIILKTHKVSLDNYDNKTDIDYQLVSNNFFKYEVTTSDDINFDPDLSYNLDLLESNNVLKTETLEIDKSYPNKLIFSSNNEYNQYDNLSLLVTKDYEITNSNFQGYFYENVFINDISSGNIYIKFNSDYIDIDSYTLDNSGIFINLFSKVKILDDDYLKIEMKIAIKNQENRTISNEARKYLTFSKNFSDSNFGNLNTEIYIIINSSNYLINKDSSGFYYINDLTDEINVFENYSIFFYFIDSFENKITTQLIYELDLNENLKNFSFKNVKPLPSNYKIDNTVVNDFTIINNNKVQVSTSNILTNPSSLNTEFRLEKKSPKLLNEISNLQNPFVIKIENQTYILDDALIYLTNDTSNISGELFELTGENRDFLFRTSINYDVFEIKDYYTVIENIKNISSYDYSENYLSFSLDNEMIIFTNSYFEYYIDISGTYMMLNNENIFTMNNVVTIYDETLDGVTLSDTFNFKQINKENKKILSNEFNQLIDVSLSNNYTTMKFDNIALQYLSSDGKEIGNYIYYFNDPNLILDLLLIYKIKSNDEALNIFLIGKYNNNIYFSTINKLESYDSYYFYSTDFSIQKNINFSNIKYLCDCYTEGLIKKINSENEFEIIIKTSEEQNLLIFPSDLNANLFFTPFNTDDTMLDLKILLKNTYSFPNELNYSRFYEEVNTQEEKKEKVIWNKKALKKIFKKIEFFMNDQKIDTLNEQILDVIEMYQHRDKQISNIPKLKNDKFYLYFPLPFWFVNSSFNYVPLIALENTNLSLKLKMNSISELINNDLTDITNKLPDRINLNLLTDTILLGSNERKQFAEFNHEYLIERNINYNDVIIKEQNRTVTLPIKGLLKEIFWIFSSKETGEYYLSNVSNDYDIYYQDYLTTKSNYDTYLNNNREFGSTISIDYKEKFIVLDNITTILEEKTDSVYLIMVTNDIYKNYNTEFLLYIFHFYLSYYDSYSDSYFGDNIEDNRTCFKLNKLLLYLSHNFKNSTKTTKESPVKTIDFKVNGRSLQAEMNASYFNNVVPYQKHKRYKDLGIFIYSFSLYPIYDQPSGQLNFNILKNPTLELEMNSLVETENVILNTIVKEYQILRILGGVASLSWI